jgi:hypothetical protein
MTNVLNKNYQRISEHFLKLHKGQASGLPEHSLIEEVVNTAETAAEKFYCARMYYAIKDLFKTSQHVLYEVKKVDAENHIVERTTTTITFDGIPNKVETKIETIESDESLRLFSDMRIASDIRIFCKLASGIAIQPTSSTIKRVTN